MVGEVADGDVDYVCDYQNYLDAVLNYPMLVLFLSSRSPAAALLTIALGIIKLRNSSRRRVRHRPI